MFTPIAYGHLHKTIFNLNIHKQNVCVSFSQLFTENNLRLTGGATASL